MPATPGRADPKTLIPAFLGFAIQSPLRSVALAGLGRKPLAGSASPGGPGPSPTQLRRKAVDEIALPAGITHECWPAGTMRPTCPRRGGKLLAPVGNLTGRRGQLPCDRFDKHRGRFARCLARSRKPACRVGQRTSVCGWKRGFQVGIAGGRLPSRRPSRDRRTPATRKTFRVLPAPSACANTSVPGASFPAMLVEVAAEAIGRSHPNAA